jgi:hypothetical protein
VTEKTAAQRLECGLKAIRKMAEAGTITYRVLPGLSRRMYDAQDVERIAAESVRESTRTEKGDR